MRQEGLVSDHTTAQFKPQKDKCDEARVGYSAGEHKTAELVREAFMRVGGNLSDIHIFHTDRGNEFKNKTIGDILEAFGIERSLSHKGCPHDNAVAEATFKIINTEKTP